MNQTTKQYFLFKCQDCGMIVSVPFEDPQDLEEVRENKMELKCPCDGKCVVLRD
jgi:DNA-directed RNA polymerase subunit RPC12/RpoP